jgi:hypothetical protein
MTRSPQNPASPFNPKKKGPKRPYAQISREKLDLATSYACKHFAHYANTTKDPAVTSLAATMLKVKESWDKIRESSQLADIRSPLKGRSVGPVVAKGDKILVVGTDYERLSIQYGAKIASSAWTVDGLVGNWVKLTLTLDPKKPESKLAHTATPRCLSGNRDKAAQAQKEIEAALQAQSGGLV